MKEIKTQTQLYCRQIEEEAKSLLETTRQQRQAEELEQKSKIDDLYLRTRAAATSIKERAEAEFQIQESLRDRYMKETDGMLSKAREELEEVVLKSEGVVRRAESRISIMKADSHNLQSNTARVKSDMHGIIKQAHEASSAALSELNELKSACGVHCRQPVDSVLQIISSAQMVLNEIHGEQEDLLRTRSRGLELEGTSAMRHAVARKELRKHLFNWTLSVNRFVVHHPPPPVSSSSLVSTVLLIYSLVRSRHSRSCML